MQKISCFACGTPLTRRERNYIFSLFSWSSPGAQTFCLRCMGIELPPKKKKDKTNDIISARESKCTSFIGSIPVGDSDICVICSKTQNTTMKMHIKGPYCLDCHLIEIARPSREYIAYRVLHEDSMYDLYGHRLCDTRGCCIYGPELNNDYNGFFCNTHYKQMRDIRFVVKRFPDTIEEYNARVEEIILRKNPSQEHITYANTLYTWLLSPKSEYLLNEDKTIQNGESESQYINNLFYRVQSISSCPKDTSS